MTPSEIRDKAFWIEGAAGQRQGGQTAWAEWGTAQLAAREPGKKTEKPEFKF